ncbi:hypothetical protein DCS_05021 [Drechmeria coniospora]|uniref:Fatty acid hydroxylase domain-containing protein n=1 Tax=Drechmeria coniospora TaxID=98403 RepID=A0A151GLP3_DRECN|nr:hypothetical protein DCS_05021 [Drechmeria coniospora]KYK58008.1 hypothetical protein DCS_05021 [Drechmeria coniospora]
MSRWTEESQPESFPAAKKSPKDSIKSTWRHLDRNKWSVFHWLIELLDIHPTSLEKAVPIHNKTDKMPYLPEWYTHRWVIIHALLPLALHQLFILCMRRNLAPFEVLLLYGAAFKLTAIRELHLLREISHQVGFLDGDAHDRDGVPNSGVAKVILSLLATSTGRSAFTVFLGYRTSETPVDTSWLLLPLQIGLYGIILDFWFYWYHRLMHEIGPLWRFHRTHHLTKHPNPLLALYADTVQELFDIAAIPLLTFSSLRCLGLELGFYEWWVCHQYIVFAELAGHSGLRLHTTPPSTLAWLLRLVKAELVIEDHDIHHRRGWRRSGNYGKQTRLWDRLFSTCLDRIECTEPLVDYANPVTFPIF